jgi:transposase-like protein
MNKKPLTPIEKSARDAIVYKLAMLGFNVNSIANIMNMNASTVSRIADKKPNMMLGVDIEL